MKLQKVEIAVDESGYLYAIMPDGTIRRIEEIYEMVRVNKLVDKEKIEFN